MGKTFRNIRKKDRKKLRQNRDKKRARTQDEDYGSSNEKRRISIYGMDG